jgi:hypothetical protein
MQLDARLPLMAAQRQPMQFAPESQLQTLSRIAPGINALRGVQQQQMERERLSSEDAAFEQLRRGAQEVLGNPNATISDLARVVINNAKTPAQFDAGQKLLQAELLYRQRKGRLAEFFDQPMTANALLRMYAEDPEAAKLLEPQVLTPSQKTVPVGQNIFERDQSGSGRFITPPRIELPVSGVRLGINDMLANPQTGAVMVQNVPVAGAGAGAETGAAAGARGSGARAGTGASAATGAPAAGKPMSESELARRRDAVAKEYRNAGTALQNLQDTLNSAELVRTAPGLARATGFTGAYLPSFTGGAAAQAQTRLENLRGKITAMGKATAAMSGAIGSIANQEWKILADQIAVIDPVKGAGPMLEQIASLEQQARSAMERIKDAYEKQYGEDFERFPQFRNLPMPAQGAGLNAPRTTAPARPAAGPRANSTAPAPSSGGWSVVR